MSSEELRRTASKYAFQVDLKRHIRARRMLGGRGWRGGGFARNLLRGEALDQKSENGHRREALRLRRIGVLEMAEISQRYDAFHLGWDVGVKISSDPDRRVHV